VGKPGDGGPVTAEKGGERPFDRIAIYAGLDMKILQQVANVIKVDEGVMIDGPVNADGNRTQSQTNERPR
jgi:hypothetical protein